MELVAENAIGRFRECLGPTDSGVAKREAPGTLRALFGTDGCRNACHGSASGPAFERENAMFFSKAFAPTASFNNNTCCVIKPHIIQEGRAGQVIDMIL
jgi:nucleoside-diphosphate kinase